MVAIVILGLTFGKHGGLQSALITSPAHDSISTDMLTALVPAMLAYNGFQMLGPLGGEVANSKSNIPRAVIIGSSVVIRPLCTHQLDVLRVLGFTRVAQSQFVASDTLALLIGQTGAQWITVMMIVSAFGALHANFLSSPRIPFAMARDGYFFAFTKRDPSSVPQSQWRRHLSRLCRDSVGPDWHIFRNCIPSICLLFSSFSR